MPELSPLYHSARAKGRTEDQLRSSNLSRTECTCGPSPFGRSAQSSCNSRPDCLLFTSASSQSVCRPLSLLSSEGQSDSHLDWSEETSVEGTATDNLPVDARKKQSLLASAESGICRKPFGDPTADSLWTKVGSEPRIVFEDELARDGISFRQRSSCQHVNERISDRFRNRDKHSTH